MKYELLKRTAIALFVGGVISSYTVAAEQPATSTNSNLTVSFNNIEKAINKNDKNIKEISKLLVGEENNADNPGLINTIDTINKQATDNANLLITMAGKVDQNKKDTDTEIAKKADKTTVEAIDAEVEVIGKNVKTIDQDLDTTIKDVKSLQGDMDKASKAVNSLSDNLKELNDTQNTLNESFKNQLNAANEALDKNESDIKEIKNLKGYDSLTKVEALVSGKADNQALEDLKKDVKDNEEGISQLSGIVDELGKDVGDLTEEHRGLEGKHNKLAEGVKEFTETYNKFTDAVHADLNEKADAEEVGKALDTKANASDVYTKAESNSKLDAKANVADVYSKTETDNKFALKADNSVVSAQAADINNLRTDVNTHKVDINKLRTDVNTHTKRLDHLDNRVNKLDKDLKRGLAAQAALTGLFQPYTVGKANFTAAVGGYKSQTAVAVGTGYRYNQNIATKAGVAFTQGGGVTYNAGVNFEW